MRRTLANTIVNQRGHSGQVKRCCFEEGQKKVETYLDLAPAGHTLALHRAALLCLLQQRGLKK